MTDDTAPYIKEHNGTNICFADTLQQATNALKRTNLGEGKPESLDNGHLMLFGVEDWKNPGDMKGAFKGPQNTFQRIEVFGCEMDKQAQLNFADTIAGGLDRVEHFDLDNTTLDPEGAAAIFSKLATAKLKKLNLQGSIANKDVMNALNDNMAEDSPIFSSLSTLDLKINDLKPESAAAVHDLMVKMANNDADEEKKLDLFYNDLQAAGAKEIANALSIGSAKGRSNITQLDLCCNNIGDEGAIAIGNALKTNVTLKELKLALNNIGNAGAIAIMSAFFDADPSAQKNTTLEILDISANVMKEDKDDETAGKQNEALFKNAEEEIAEIDKRLEELAEMGEHNEAEETEQRELERKRGELLGAGTTGHTRPLLAALSSVFTRAHNLEEFDFTGIEFDTQGWDSLAEVFVNTKNVVGREKAPMTIKFSIVDLMSEENLNIMNAKIWNDNLKNDFAHIDWRRREDANATN